MSAQGKAEQDFQQEYEKGLSASGRCRTAPSGGCSRFCKRT